MLGGLDNLTSGKVIVTGQDISQLSDEELTILKKYLRIKGFRKVCRMAYGNSW